MQYIHEYCEKWGIAIARTTRRMMAGESARDSGLTAQQEMNRVMVEIMNRLKTEIEDRTVRLQELRDRFAFLLNLHSVAVAIADEKEREITEGMFGL